MSKLLVPLAVFAVLSGCAASRGAMRAELPPLQLESAAPAPQILTEDHFTQDRSSITEAELKTILAAPVFLEETARVGVVPVAGRYELDAEVPTLSVPAALAESLEASNLFEASSEVSTDWPAERGVAGLREIAARYRTEYLVLYRQRFVDQSYVNPWAVGYATVVGAFFLPANTLEAAGVLEATLFDVKTGTILFTVYERVQGTADVNNWQNDRKLSALKRKLLADASGKLADQVVHKCRRLVAARPAPVREQAVSQATITVGPAN
jgi:hypothetical protein